MLEKLHAWLTERIYGHDGFPVGHGYRRVMPGEYIVEGDEYATSLGMDKIGWRGFQVGGTTEVRRLPGRLPSPPTSRLDTRQSKWLGVGMGTRHTFTAVSVSILLAFTACGSTTTQPTTQTAAAPTTATVATTTTAAALPAAVRAGARKIPGIDQITDTQIDAYGLWLCTTLAGKDPSGQHITELSESLWDLQDAKTKLSPTNPAPKLARNATGAYSIVVWDVYC